MVARHRAQTAFSVGQRAFAATASVAASLDESFSTEMDGSQFQGLSGPSWHGIAMSHSAVMALSLAATTILVVAFLTLLIFKKRRGQLYVNKFDCDMRDQRCSIREQSIKISYSSAKLQPDNQEVDRLKLSKHKSVGKVPFKAKGLLERRASNISLTLDLGSLESFDLDAPSDDEKNVVHLLTSLSRPLSRRTLWTCLENAQTLHEEFSLIPANYSRRLEIQGASAKNRYRSIWPNDRTRVVLRTHSRLDHERYVNANYIKGFNDQPRAFIAAQGPMANTVSDFWAMVWQERCAAVVMMTSLRERQVVKCEPYLPTACHQWVQHGDIWVSVRSATTAPVDGYAVREVELRRAGGAERREVRHLWMCGWPDNQAPPGVAEQLVALVMETRRVCVGVEAAPLLVHCSAGLGRTGCFIALAICVEGLLREREGDSDCVDVLRTVARMRLDRGGMVQTAEQYELVHRALVRFESKLAK